MADVITNLTIVANAVKAEYWQKTFLSTLEANLLYTKWGIEGEIPAGEGKNAFWPRFENIAMTVTAQAAASEGKLVFALKKLLKIGENLCFTLCEV